MDRLGPFEPRPRLAVAVSGGADSMALAILIRDWVRQRDGSATALVVDHGLRAASADEARITVERLTGLGIPARLLSIGNLTHGPALAERARIARYEILGDACREAGILHLLLGHHAADQMETLAMRMLRGSGPHGLACMSAIRETAGLRLLRPMLGIEPARLRDFLKAQGVEWVEDPSNQDTRALRPRLRQRLGATSPNETGLTEAIAAVARTRSHEEAETAAELARRAIIRPEGFALLSPGPISPMALACLVQTIGGSAYSPALAQIENLAAEPRAATIAGVRMMPAGRFGHGMLIVREEAAIAAPIAASADVVWDNRFRLCISHGPAVDAAWTGAEAAPRPVIARSEATWRSAEESAPVKGTPRRAAPRDDGAGSLSSTLSLALAGCPEGAVIGKLGPDAARFRDRSDLPSAVLRTLPAIRVDKNLAAVPHLGYAIRDDVARMTLLFHPPRPFGAACFVPAI